MLRGHRVQAFARCGVGTASVARPIVRADRTRRRGRRPAAPRGASKRCDLPADGTQRTSYHVRLEPSTVMKVLARYRMPLQLHVGVSSGIAVRKARQVRYEGSNRGTYLRWCESAAAGGQRGDNGAEEPDSRRGEVGRGEGRRRKWRKIRGATEENAP